MPLWVSLVWRITTWFSSSPSALCSAAAGIRSASERANAGKKLLFTLFIDGIQFITKLKSNMKGQIMTIGDRILLRKRALIETINDELKNMAQIEHSRHRSVVGFTVNLMAGLAAYSFFPKKPMIDVERVSPYENGVIQLSLF